MQAETGNLFQQQNSEGAQHEIQGSRQSCAARISNVSRSIPVHKTHQFNVDNLLQKAHSSVTVITVVQGHN